MAIGLGGSCFLLGIFLLVSEFCLDDITRFCCGKASSGGGSRNGYTTIPDVSLHDGGNSRPSGISTVDVSDEYIQDDNSSRRLEAGRASFEIERK